MKARGKAFQIKGVKSANICRMTQIIGVSGSVER